MGRRFRLIERCFGRQRLAQERGKAGGSPISKAWNKPRMWDLVNRGDHWSDLRHLRVSRQKQPVSSYGCQSVIFTEKPESLALSYQEQKV